MRLPGVGVCQGYEDDGGRRMTGVGGWQVQEAGKGRRRAREEAANQGLEVASELRGQKAASDSYHAAALIRNSENTVPCYSPNSL